MRNIIGMLMIIISGVTMAQTKVTEVVKVKGQTLLELDFSFADDITIKTWDRDEVKVDVDVTINDGEDDEIFKLKTEEGSSTITIRMDQDMWENASKKNNNCSWKSELYYTVYLPKSMNLEASTISGNFILEPYGKETTLKTISGDIDITVREGLSFHAKTISGEVYSDLNIDYPDGKEGLEQIVGMNVSGQVSKGSPLMELETISGNIYLRKG